MSEDESHKSKINPDQFCFYPFSQLLLQPTGNISPCCFNQEIVFGNISNQSLQEIWNGERIQKLREEFLSGKPVSCLSQMKHIGCHNWSRRNYEAEIELKKEKKQPPMRLDVRLNGRCNLACVMCDVWQQPNGMYESSDFWTEGPELFFPFLKEIDVLGGEPFIQSDTYRLIDEVSEINPECSWAFVTNANYKFSDSIKKRLDKIVIRWMQVSLDSINSETYKKIRVNGDLEKTLKTLDALISYRDERASKGKGFSVVVSMCVQKDNWQEVGDFLKFAKTKKNLECTLQFAFQPDEVSLSKQPLDIINMAYAYMKSLEKEFGGDILMSIASPLKDSLSNDVK